MRYRLRTNKWPVAVGHPALLLPLWYALRHESADWRHHALSAELTPLLSRAVWAHMGGAPGTHVGPGLTSQQHAWLHAWCSMKRGHPAGDTQGDAKYPRTEDTAEARRAAEVRAPEAAPPRRGAVEARRTRGAGHRIAKCVADVRAAAAERKEFVVGIVHGTDASVCTLVARGLRLTEADAHAVFARTADMPGMWTRVVAEDGTLKGVVAMSTERATNPVRTTWLLERALAAAAWYRLARRWQLIQAKLALDERASGVDLYQLHFTEVLDAQAALIAASPIVTQGGLVALDRINEASMSDAIESMRQSVRHASGALARTLGAPEIPWLGVDDGMQRVPFGADVPFDEFNAARVEFEALLAGISRNAAAARASSPLVADGADPYAALAAENAVARAKDRVKLAITDAVRRLTEVAANAPGFMADAPFIAAASMEDALPIDLVELIRTLTVENADVALVDVVWARLAPMLATVDGIHERDTWQRFLDDVHGAVGDDRQQSVIRLLARAIKPLNEPAIRLMRPLLDAEIVGDESALRWWTAHDQLGDTGPGVAPLSNRIARLRAALDAADPRRPRHAVQNAWTAIVGDHALEHAVVMSASPANRFAPATFLTEKALPAWPWARWVWRTLREGVANPDVSLADVEERLEMIKTATEPSPDGNPPLGAYAERVPRVHPSLMSQMWRAATDARHALAHADRVILYAGAVHAGVERPDAFLGMLAHPGKQPNRSVRALLRDVTADRSDVAVRAAHELARLSRAGVWSPVEAWFMFADGITRLQGVLGTPQELRMAMRDLAARPNRWTFLIELVDAGGIPGDQRHLFQPEFKAPYIVALGPDGAEKWLYLHPWHFGSLRQPRSSGTIFDAPVHMATWRIMVDTLAAKWRELGEAVQMNYKPLAALEEWLDGATSHEDARAIVAAFNASALNWDVVDLGLWDTARADANRLRAANVRAFKSTRPANNVMLDGKLRTAAIRWFHDAEDLAAVACFVKHDRGPHRDRLRLTLSDIVSLAMKPTAVAMFQWRAAKPAIGNAMISTMQPVNEHPMRGASIINKIASRLLRGAGTLAHTRAVLDRVVAIAEASWVARHNGSPKSTFDAFVDWHRLDGVVPSHQPRIWLQAGENEASFAERLVAMGASMSTAVPDAGMPPGLLPRPADATPEHTPLANAEGTPWMIPPPPGANTLDSEELDAMQRGFKRAASHNSRFRTSDPMDGAAIVVAVAARRFAANDDAGVAAGFGESAWWWQSAVPMELAIDPLRLLYVIWDIPTYNEPRAGHARAIRKSAPSPDTFRLAQEAVTLWVFATLQWVPTRDVNRDELTRVTARISAASAVAGNAVREWANSLGSDARGARADDAGAF